jgi:hypothetical protein
VEAEAFVKVGRFVPRQSLSPRTVRRAMSGGAFLRPLVILFALGQEQLEAVVHLRQFPENRQQLDCDYEEQQWNNHFWPLGQEMSYAMKPHYRHGVNCFSNFRLAVTISERAGGDFISA